MRANAEDRRECVRTMSRWRNARTARAYRGRRVAAVFDCGCACGDGGDLELVGWDKGVVVANLTGMKGVDGRVGDIVRVVVGMFKHKPFRNKLTAPAQKRSSTSVRLCHVRCQGSCEFPRPGNGNRNTPNGVWNGLSKIKPIFRSLPRSTSHPPSFLSITVPQHVHFPP